jgi:hypothetical protein
MLRLVLPAVALAAVLATVTPAFADPLDATASDHAQAAAAATQPATPSAPASSRSSDVIAAASAKDSSPVGFGWG